MNLLDNAITPEAALVLPAARGCEHRLAVVSAIRSALEHAEARIGRRPRLAFVNLDIYAILSNQNPEWLEAMADCLSDEMGEEDAVKMDLLHDLMLQSHGVVLSDRVPGYISFLGVQIFALADEDAPDVMVPANDTHPN